MNEPSSLPEQLSDEQVRVVCDLMTKVEVLPISCLHYRADEQCCISRNRVIPDDFIYILKEGALECRVGDVRKVIHPGEFIMVPAGCPHDATVPDGTDYYEVFALHLHIYDDTQYRFFERLTSSFGTLSCTEGWFRRLAACTCLMGKAPEEGGRYMQQIVTQLVADHLLRGNTVKTLPRKTDQRIEKLLGEIRLSPAADWRVTRMAERCHLSLSRFRQLFVTCTGTSPKKYVQQVRLSLARSLLVTKPALTVEQVADEVGFSDAHYFHAIYRKMFDETPKKRSEQP